MASQLFCPLPGAFDWARNTLDMHRKDKREYVYTRAQLEAAKTHDDLWNAAQVRKSSGRNSASQYTVATLLN